MIVLYISDTTTMESISKSFDSCYGEIFGFINKQGLKPGRVMAFYHSYKNPVILDAAVEIDRLPSILEGRVRIKAVEGGDVVVAHYKGPYEEMELPYKALAEWLEDHDKEGRGIPFEVYLNAPGAVKSKYDLQTDVYQLLR